MIAQLVDTHLLGRMLSEENSSLDWDSFSPEDWGQVVGLSEAEGVGPQLYWALSGSEKISLLPKVEQDHLRAMFAATRLNNNQILRELETLTGRFDQAGIPVVALKGICFALTIYPDIGLRPMADLDLLVPKSRLAEAVGIARNMSYKEMIPEALPGIDGLLNHAVGLLKTTTPFSPLELHYSLVAEKSFSYAVPVDWFWTQTEPMPETVSETGLGSLRMLTPTAQILYASAHAILKHGMRNTPLRWVYDLDRLVRFHADRIDWNLLLSQAGEFEWGSAVYTALSLTTRTFDTPISKATLERFSRMTDRNVELIMTYHREPVTHTLEEYQKLKYLDWPSRIAVVLALVAPSPQYMRWRYKLSTNRSLPARYFYRWRDIFEDVLHTMKILTLKDLETKRHKTDSTTDESNSL